MPRQQFPGFAFAPEGRSGLSTLGKATAILIVLLLPGCGNRSKEPVAVSDMPPEMRQQLSQNVSRGAPVPPNAQPDSEGVAAAPRAPAKPVVIQPTADLEAALAEMNRALRRWIVSNQRLPKSYDEFANSARLSAPPPPQGKKYVLTKQMKIVLEDQ